MGSSGAEVGPLRWRILGLGKAVALFALASGLLAVRTGNGAMYGVFALSATLLLVESLLGVWNLHQLRLSRRLPEELYAGRPAAGVLLVENTRRFFSSYQLHLEEESSDPLAPRPAATALAELPARGRVEARADYRFAQRGRATLVSLRLGSRFPFGFFARWRVVPMPAELLIFPAPLSGPPSETEPSSGVNLVDTHLPGGTGDLHQLRPYQPGDPFHGVSWPASAHRGRLMVAERQRDATEEAVVVIEPRQKPELWERQLRQASGLVISHARLGRAIGLRVQGGPSWPPRPGAEQRRRLLTALALLPPAEEGPP